MEKIFLPKAMIELKCIHDTWTQNLLINVCVFFSFCFFPPLFQFYQEIHSMEIVGKNFIVNPFIIINGKRNPN